MGRPRKGTLGTFNSSIVNEIKSIRDNQENWGPKTIAIELKHTSRFSELKTPSRASIARFLKEQGYTQAPTKRANPDDVDNLPMAEYPHQRWQIDARGNESLNNVGIISLINLKDVKTNICLLYTSPSPRDATLSRMPSSA